MKTLCVLLVILTRSLANVTVGIRTPEPKLIVSFENVEARIGSTAKLVCEVKSNVSYELSFSYRDYDKLGLISKDDSVQVADPRISVGRRKVKDRDEWTLTIDNVSEEDAGGYRCSIKTSRSSARSVDARYAKLAVSSPPSPQPNSSNLEQMEATMTLASETNEEDHEDQEYDLRRDHPKLTRTMTTTKASIGANTRGWKLIQIAMPALLLVGCFY